MYKIYKKGRMSANLFFNNLNSAKKSVEKYFFEKRLPQIQMGWNNEFNVIKTEWKKVKNKNRFYVQFEGLKDLFCAETIIHIA